MQGTTQYTSRLLNGDMIVNGKYKGLTLNEAAGEKGFDSWLNYMIKNCNQDADRVLLKSFLEDQPSKLVPVITFGKYKGSRLDALATQDGGYLNWMYTKDGLLTDKDKSILRAYCGGTPPPKKQVSFATDVRSVEPLDLTTRIVPTRPQEGTTRVFVNGTENDLLRGAHSTGHYLNMYN